MTGTRILHVVSGDLWAGAEAQVAALMKQLSADPTLELHAVLFNPGELERRIHEAGVQVTVLDESCLNTFQLFAGLRRIVRSFRPDVVHTHRDKENVLGAIAARWEGRRASLRTVHGAPEHWPAWWRVDKQLSRLLDDWTGRGLQFAAVTVSEDLGRRLREVSRRWNVEVIHNGIAPADYSALRQRHLDRPQGHTRRVVFLGRLVPIKRVDLFLRMARAMIDGSHADVRFEVIGEGPLQAELQKLAQNLGLGASVHFQGFRQDALQILAGSDVLVFSSDHEGTPMAALESLAIGVPIVARAVGGLPELLTGVAGCRLVDSDSPSDLAAAVAAALESSTGRLPELPPRYDIRHSAGLYRELYARAAAVRP